MKPTAIVDCSFAIERTHLFELHVEQVTLCIPSLGLRLRVVKMLVTLDGKPLFWHCFYVRQTPHVIEIREEYGVAA